MRNFHCSRLTGNTFLPKLGLDALADLGGRARHTPPYGTQFFRFGIHFHRKVPTLEVHVPPNGCTPPTGNPGSATVDVHPNLVEMEFKLAS